MKQLLLVLSAGIILTACTKEPEAPVQPETTPPETVTKTAPARPDSSGDIGIITGGAGGMAPVTGAEGIQGGGSGVGQAAKERAKRIGTTSTAQQYYDQAEGE